MPSRNICRRIISASPIKSRKFAGEETSITMGFWRQFAEYLYIKKKDPNAPSTQWMKYMHGINRISLFMFLIAIIIVIVKMIMRKH